MKIETKFEIGQKVWIMLDNRVQQKEIVGIITYIGKTKSTSHGSSSLYHFKNQSFSSEVFNRTEDEIFSTKQELLDSL